MWWLIIIFVVVCILSAGGGEIERTSKKHQRMLNEQSAIFRYAKDFREEYEANPLAFNSKYNNKAFALHGTVTKITNYGVFYVDEQYCGISSQHEDQLLDIRVGQLVYVKGLWVVECGIGSLRECTITVLKE